ncbi:MAG: CCA tRNA nucleotidyltransferase [Dehalococcoidia bacterium]|nr:CCA tRNA nucleotidyltransferase [Dehalococcoidia bacterium]
MNVSDRLEQRLASVRLSVLRELSQLATGLGIDLYLVGGSVRDVLADAPLTDIDIMASGSAERLVESIRGRGDVNVRKASAFGTWSLTVRGVDVDLATARRETYERPGALPTVIPGTVEEDLARRDFSINAMAVSLGEDSWGTLLDPHEGVTDLSRGVIRVLHDRSFEDDATRILRAIRYACRLDFRLESCTATLLERSLPYVSRISPDRVRHEIERIFQEPRAGDMIEMAGKLGVLAAIHPGLRAEQKTLRDLQTETGDNARKAHLLLGSMVQSVADGDMESVVERLNLNSDWTRLVRDVAAVRGRLYELEDENVARSRVYRLLQGLHPHAVESCAMAATDTKVGDWLRLYLDELRHVRPLLDGDDLMALGVREGPEVGLLLTKLLDARLDGLVESVEDEEAMVRRALRM